MKRFSLAFTAIIVMLCGAITLSAQTSQGRILGSVTDQTGAVVPGAKVTITNTATGAARALTTTGAGEYAAPNLDAGPYTISAEASGFKK